MNNNNEDIQTNLVEEEGQLRFSKDQFFEEMREELIGQRPDLFLQNMKECGLLEKFLPELDRLSEFEHTPDKHPEGDVFVHTKQVVLATSILTKLLTNNCDESLLVKNVLAASFHDVGKAVTQEYDKKLDRYRYIGHEKEGVPIVNEIIRRMWYCNIWEVNHMQVVTEHHMLLHNDFTKIKPIKILTKFLGAIVKKQFSKDELKIYEDCFVTSKGLQQNTDLNIYVTNLLSKRIEIRNLMAKLPQRYKEEVKAKLVDKTEWDAIMNSSENEKLAYLKSKMIGDGFFNKYYYYQREVGICEKTEWFNFMFVCAADALGRLKNDADMVEIFSGAAEIIKTNTISSKTNVEQMLGSWKRKFSLIATYVDDFKIFLLNDALLKEFLIKRIDIKPTLSIKELEEKGLMRDDVEYHFFEDYRKQEVQLWKSILKIYKS